MNSLEDIPWTHKNIQSYEELDEAVKMLLKERVVGFDLETEGLEWYAGDRICGIGLGCIRRSSVDTFYIPIRHSGLDFVPVTENLEPQKVFKKIAPILQSREIRKVGANIKFDIHCCFAEGVKIRNCDDVQVLARILRTDLQHVGLKKLVPIEFNAEHEEEVELKKWFRKNKIKFGQRTIEKKAYSRAPVSLVGVYCGADVRWTLLLALKYFKELKNDPKLKNLYDTIERPLLGAIVKMEMNGIAIDKSFLERLGEDLTKEIDELEKSIHEEAGQVFDIASTQQLKEILIPLGVKPEMRRRKKGDTTTKSESIDEKTLSVYREKIPLVDSVLRYRERTKIRSTYVSNILQRGYINSSGVFKVHADIKQDRARTGRLSCAEPNLTNIPRAGEEFSAIRDSFIPLSGRSRLISIDLSNIEYRLLAHFSREPRLIEIFESGGDFHGMVAEILKIERYLAKTFNFAQLYGAGIKRLADQTKLPEKTCKDVVHQYNVRFPGINSFKLGVERYARKHHGVRNPFGRWRVITPGKEYVGVNTLIQSSAADVLKLILLRVTSFLRDKKSKLLFPVHDEIVIDHDPYDGDIVTPILTLMTNFTKKDGSPMFAVPISAEVSFCDKCWGKKHEMTIGDYLSHCFSDLDSKEDRINSFRKDPSRAKYLNYIIGKIFSGGPFSKPDIEWMFDTMCKIDTLLKNDSSPLSFLWGALNERGVEVNAVELRELQRQGISSGEWEPKRMCLSP